MTAVTDTQKAETKFAMNEAIILTIAFLSREPKPVQTCYDSGEPAGFKLWHSRALSWMAVLSSMVSCQ